jgi:hypothetical protein
LCPASRRTRSTNMRIVSSSSTMRTVSGWGRLLQMLGVLSTTLPPGRPALSIPAFPERLRTLVRPAPFFLTSYRPGPIAAVILASTPPVSGGSERLTGTR